MIRNLKALGLALVAFSAMSALGASSASAADHFTTSTGEPALLTGVTHDDTWHIPNSMSHSCTTTTLIGTVMDGSTELTVDPKYEGTSNVTPHTHHCTSSAGSVTVDVNGCHYVFTGNTTGHDPIGFLDATIWLQCPAGKAIQVTGAFGCTISIPSQTPTTGGVTYHNLSTHQGGAAIKVTTTATGMTFTATAACGFLGIPSHGNNATTNGSVTLTGYVDVNGLPTPITEGGRVGVEVS